MRYLLVVLVLATIGCGCAALTEEEQSELFGNMPDEVTITLKTVSKDNPFAEAQVEVYQLDGGGSFRWGDFGIPITCTPLDDKNKRWEVVIKKHDKWKGPKVTSFTHTGEDGVTKTYAPGDTVWIHSEETDKEEEFTLEDGYVFGEDEDN